MTLSTSRSDLLQVVQAVSLELETNQKHIAQSRIALESLAEQRKPHKQALDELTRQKKIEDKIIEQNWNRNKYLLGLAKQQGLEILQLPSGDSCKLREYRVSRKPSTKAVAERVDTWAPATPREEKLKAKLQEPIEGMISYARFFPQSLSKAKGLVRKAFKSKH